MLKFKTHSGIHTLFVVQKLPVDLERAWDYFSTPKNLAEITPAHMGFEITSELKEKKMFPGQIISYKVYPFRGISTSWITEITHVRDNQYFVDEQRFGPYSMWHHEHWFREIKGGVEMTDRVSYKVPFGFLGKIMEKFFIRKQLQNIFEFRHKKLIELFGPFEEKHEQGKKDLAVNTG